MQLKGTAFVNGLWQLKGETTAIREMVLVSPDVRGFAQSACREGLA